MRQAGPALLSPPSAPPWSWQRIGSSGEEFLYEGRQVLGFGHQVKMAAVVDAQLASRDQAVQDPRVYLRDDGVIVAGEYQGGLTHQRQ